MAEPRCLHCTIRAAVERWAEEHGDNQVTLSQIARAVGRVMNDLTIVAKLDHMDCVPGILDALLNAYGMQTDMQFMGGPAPDKAKMN